MGLKPFTPRRLRRRVFVQLWMLALQFVLGMLLNLMGEETTGAKHAVYIIVLATHILNAIGLVEGGLFVAIKERSRLAWWAAAALVATFGAGVLSVITKQDIWSFGMACGFLASAGLNIVLYIRADRAMRNPPET